MLHPDESICMKSKELIPFTDYETEIPDYIDHLLGVLH